MPDPTPTPDPAATPSVAAPGTGATEDSGIQQALADAQTSLDDLQDVMGAGLTEFASEPDLAGIDLLSDVELTVTIELGRTEMLVEDVLKLGAGSVVELDKLAGDPVDVYVNGRHVARGEVLVLNDNFCIRISEIIADLDQSVQDLLPGGASGVADSGGDTAA
ncbi:MAG: flagellar motor switch protein FliN [Planctomycetota bacterium]